MRLSERLDSISTEVIFVNHSGLERAIGTSEEICAGNQMKRRLQQLVLFGPRVRCTRIMGDIVCLYQGTNGFFNVPCGTARPYVCEWNSCDIVILCFMNPTKLKNIFMPSLYMANVTHEH